MPQQVKLTTAQERLLRALQSSVTLTYHPASFACNAYFQRSDTLKQCNAAAKGLERTGLIQNVSRCEGRTRRYELTEAGRAWPNLPQEEETTS